MCSSDLSPQAAHDAASAGDTIYIENSAVNYGSFTLTKPLYIFGPGYFLAENDSTQANVSSAMVQIVYFNAGSAGSLVSGMVVTDRIDINESNITVKRNFIQNSGIRVMNNASNVMILQNYIYCTYNGSSYNPVKVNTGSSNIFIQNNYLQRTITIYDVLNIAGTSSAQISNNIFYEGSMNVVNSTFSNNIWVGLGTLTESGNSYNNNLCEGSQFPATNGNQLNVDMTTVFDSTQTSSDAIWKLKAGSPAIAAGLSGEDCGMFGGLDPYRLSGIPPMPSIFFFQAPSSGSASSGLPVNIKIKSNN